MNRDQITEYEWPQPGDVEALMMRARGMRAAYFAALFAATGRRLRAALPRAGRRCAGRAQQPGHG